MWFIKTIVFSSILGISLGTTAGLTAQLLKPVDSYIPYVQPAKIILASNNEDCCVKSEEDIPTVGHEITAAQIITGEEIVDTPTDLEPLITESIQAAIVEIKDEPITITSPIPQPSATPTPTEETAKPEGDKTPISGLNPQVLTDLINQHRQKIGLLDFLTDENLCSLAQNRASELFSEFSKGILHSGLYNRNLPYWITENAILMRTELQAFQWWLNSPIHRRQLEGDYKYGCLACSGFQCAHVFTSYTPKIKSESNH